MTEFASLSPEKQKKICEVASEIMEGTAKLVKALHEKGTLKTVQDVISTLEVTAEIYRRPKLMLQLMMALEKKEA